MRHRLPILLLLLAACQSNHVRAEHQYHQLLNLLREQGGTEGLREEGRTKLEALYATVEGWAQTGRLQTAQDKLWASASLLHAESPERVMLALQLAQEAEAGGEVRARAILAQALDKRAMQEGLPQPYGTQYQYFPHPGIWVLYQVDPNTTDEARAASGVPPLSELRALVQRLNDQRQKDLLEWADQNRPSVVR